MAGTTEEVMEKLGASYKELVPLLNYLKVRLKYDTVRWIRTHGTKDDIVFSTRIKTFDRVYDKLIRKVVPLSKQSSVLDIALSEQGILDDLVGIRLICFDPFNIFTLISYFLITERVTTSQRNFYISPKVNLNNPLCRFLQSHGFTPVQKPDREYEDINFIIRFSHPIDKYFGSGLEKFKSLAQRAEPPVSEDKLSALNTLFDQLRDESPHLIRAISQFPIECQIVTATQHIYNRTQRPHYEYFLQSKKGEPTIADAEVRDLTERLELLKLNLLAIDQNVYSIHKKLGIQYEAPLRINPGLLFGLEGRLPKDILGENSRIEKMNTELLPKLIDPVAKTLERQKALNRILEDIKHINQRILERAAKYEDISPYNLLHVGDLEELSHPEIMFWAFQRITLLILCTLLTYVHDELVLQKVVSSLKFISAFDSDESEGHTLTDVDIVLGRLFERLEHIDYAIHSKLLISSEKIKNWREGYFYESIFSDPAIQWRYASFMYRKREYMNALQEMKVGIAVHNQLEDLKRRGVQANFPVPERALFARRSVEYELCAEISNLKYSPVAVAGILEICNITLSHYEDWKRRLGEVIEQSGDLTEQARCLCFQILFKMCALSAGGLAGEVLGVVREEYGRRFEAVEIAITRNAPNSIKDRTWWLLTKSIMSEKESARCLAQFSNLIREVVHHPVERKQFEVACATLIALWMPEGVAVKARSEFSANTLSLLKDQTERIKSEAISQIAVEQSKMLASLLTEVLRELSAKGKIETQDSISRKITGFVGDAVEHIVIDTAVAGLKSVLGI